MGLRDCQFKDSYDSDDQNILQEFFVPALSNSVEYLRLAGYFSSNVLAAAARGLSGFVRNNGKMKLIVGARLSEEDVEAIRKGSETKEAFLAKMMINSLDDIESEFVRDHVRALAWMVANQTLEIKVAIPIRTDTMTKARGIYHPKIGILLDNENPPNMISFSGSVNESAMGWKHNIEEFKVFRSWIAEQNIYLQTDLARFSKYWDGAVKRAIIIDIPTAVKKRLIEFAPKTFDELSLEKYENKRRKLWNHQKKAIQAWVDNGYRGILAMATGTGKTLTALSASTLPGSPMVTLVLVPTIPLLDQWAKKDIPSFDNKADIITCGGMSSWKTVLPLKLANVRRQNTELKNRLYVVATLKTASSKAFLLAWGGIPPEKVQLISDEVHHLGAPVYRDCEKIPCERRMGLSATPERDWDDEGTQNTVDFIGKTVYEYLIEDAIRDGHLSRFNYFPHFAYLNGQEWEEYVEKTAEIGREMAKMKAKDKVSKGQRQESGSKRLERLLTERATIKKKASDKDRVLRRIVSEITDFPVILFCEDHEQLDSFLRVLRDNGSRFLVYYSGNEKKKMNAAQRKLTLEHFHNGDADFLVAMKCLDEGLDVPNCKGCIIAASSNSTRQFVQRRGRILRGFKGKIAFLHDMIVLPPESIKGRGSAAETLIKQEMNRMCNLVKAAENEWSARDLMRGELNPFGMDYLANL